MKYQIRLCEQYIIDACTKAITLDPEDFRHILNSPYTGSSEREFLDFIKEYITNNFRDGDTEGLPDHVVAELDKLEGSAEWTEYSDSRSKYGNFYYQLGEVNENNHNNGGFDAHLTTADD
jgi:hypothetical protein